MWGACSLSMGGGGQQGHSGLPSSLGTLACMCTMASVPGQKASWKVSLQTHWGFTLETSWAGMLNAHCRPMRKCKSFNVTLFFKLSV